MQRWRVVIVTAVPCEAVVSGQGHVHYSCLGRMHPVGRHAGDEENKLRKKKCSASQPVQRLQR